MTQKYNCLIWKGKGYILKGEYSSYEEADNKGQSSGKMYLVEPVRHKLQAINTKIQTKHALERFIFNYNP